MTNLAETKFEMAASNFYSVLFIGSFNIIKALLQNKMAVIQ